MVPRPLSREGKKKLFKMKLGDILVDGKPLKSYLGAQRGISLTKVVEKVRAERGWVKKKHRKPRYVSPKEEDGPVHVYSKLERQREEVIRMTPKAKVVTHETYRKVLKAVMNWKEPANWWIKNGMSPVEAQQITAVSLSGWLEHANPGEKKRWEKSNVSSRMVNIYKAFSEMEFLKRSPGPHRLWQYEVSDDMRKLTLDQAVKVLADSMRQRAKDKRDLGKLRPELLSPEPSKPEEEEEIEETEPLELAIERKGQEIKRAEVDIWAEPDGTIHVNLGVEFK